MYLYFLRVVFTVVKVVKVSSRSFSHCFIVISIRPTKATCDTYARESSFLKNAKNAPQERQAAESVFSPRKNTSQLSREACATKTRKSHLSVACVVIEKPRV